MNPSADSPASKRTDILAPGDMTDDRIRRRVFAGGLLALVVASWSYLVYQDWAMRHMDLVHMAMPGAGPWSSADFVLVFVMWAVMMIAMMLPSVLPTLRAYRAVVSTRNHQRRPDALTAVFAAGYVFTWTIFSAIATLTQSILHAFTLVSPAMRAASPSIAGALLIAAGVYQWTPSKRVCLAQCASPLQFLLRHWRPGASGAWRMGIVHGAYCAGCCWMLMALLFVYGMMNLAWIIAIAMYVLSEKLLPAQRWLPRLAGALLIFWGGTVLSIAWR
jgi:Predicted metal-binding integral membrane protein